MDALLVILSIMRLGAAALGGSSGNTRDTHTKMQRKKCSKSISGEKEELGCNANKHPILQAPEYVSSNSSLWYTFSKVWLCQKSRQQVLSTCLAVGPRTFSSLAFMEAVMEVGLMNWKDGAALLGYWTGNITSILTRWLPQCTDTVQLRFTASICVRNSNSLAFRSPRTF